jgi:hypothetical protein
MEREITPDEIIDALGGTSEVARLCEIQPPSVSEWRKLGIPKAQLKFLRLARPGVFAGLGLGEPVPARRAGDLQTELGRAGRNPTSRENVMTSAIEQQMPFERGG